LGRLNSNLKEIGTLEKVEKNGAKQRKEKEDAPFSYISWYYARHTWATIAAELDISDDIIALALGHGKKTVTDIYIKRNLKKVDDANRKVIDYVNNYNPEEDIGEKHAEKNVETADEIKSLTSADLLKNIEELVAKLDNPESLTPHDVEGLKILNWMYEKEKGKYAIKPQKHTLMQRKRTLKPKIKS
jgi:hypothetical protein